MPRKSYSLHSENDFEVGKTDEFGYNDEMDLSALTAGQVHLYIMYSNTFCIFQHHY